MDHTELPWKVEKFKGVLEIAKGIESICEVAPYYPDLGTKQAKQKGAANAAFIVRACNNHYKLLEACKEAVTFISGLQIDITREDTYANECQTLLEQAIAEAEGQS